MTITGQVAPSGKKSFAELDFVGLCDRLAEKKATLVIFHAHPDGDAVGSAFSLSLLLGAAGSPTFVSVPTRFQGGMSLRSKAFNQACPGEPARELQI